MKPTKEIMRKIYVLQIIRLEREIEGIKKHRDYRVNMLQDILDGQLYADKHKEIIEVAEVIKKTNQQTQTLEIEMNYYQKRIDLIDKKAEQENGNS